MSLVRMNPPAPRRAATSMRLHFALPLSESLQALATVVLAPLVLALRRGVPRLLSTLVLAALVLSIVPGRAAAQSDGLWRTYLYANDVRDVVASGDDVYAATSGGLVRWTTEGFEQWTREPLGLLSDSLRTAIADGGGNIWVGTERVGISIFTPDTRSFAPYTSLLEPIPGDRIRRLRLQTDGEGREVLLVAAEQGYSSFVDGDLRAPCLEGVDICDLPSFDILDLALLGDELWIATAEGLVVQHADGSWSPVTTPFDIGILAVYENGLLAAGGGGILRRSDDAWVEIGIGLPSPIVVNELLPRSGSVLLAASGSAGGVFEWNENAGWNRLGADVFPATSVTVTESGLVVAGASDVSERLDGIWEWDGTSWRQRKVPGPALRAYYRSLRMADDGVLWFTTAERSRAPLVGSFDGSSWLLRNGGENGSLGSWTFSTEQVGDEVFLAHCCCREGDPTCALESFIGSEFRAFEDISEIWTLDVDEDGFLWGATNNGDETLSKGVYRVDPVARTFELFDAASVGFPSNQIAAIRVANEVAWVGTYDSGLVRWSFGPDGIPQGAGGDDVIRVYTSSSSIDPIASNAIRQIEVASDGRAWIGTTGGLSVYESNGTFTNLTAGAGRLPNAEITALAVDRSGGAWVGTRDTGLTRIAPDPEGGYVYTTYRAPLLPNPNVEALALTSDDRTVWCGTSRGLASFTPIRSVETGSTASVAPFPNPYILGCTDGLRLSGGGGLLSGVVVDLDGTILARFDDVTSDDVVWDVTHDGEPAAPGLYIVRVQGPRKLESVGVAVLDGDCSR
ncbi:MAG: hypothetical protein R3E97_22255 [Candidatus Eisenbacteria bacterium]